MKPSFDPLSSHPRWSYSMSLPLFLQGSIDGSESAAESTGDISFQTKGRRGNVWQVVGMIPGGHFVVMDWYKKKDPRLHVLDKKINWW